MDAPRETMSGPVPAGAVEWAHEPAIAVETTMKAVVQDGYGSADVLELRDIDKPEVADDEVLVRVHAAGVDRGVWHLMTGQAYVIRLAGYGIRRPKHRVRGRELAGRVEAIGQAVTRFRPGDEVIGTCEGSFAEYACAREDKLASKPANLTFDQAAAVPISASTALQALRDQGQVHPGQKVLIIGASVAWEPSRCNSPRRSEPTSPAFAARQRLTWSAPSAPTTLSITPVRTSPMGDSAMTSSSTSEETVH
jgi:Alcohol dehydrogenase GroES-like domain